jgi:hypothetical protein
MSATSPIGQGGIFVGFSQEDSLVFNSSMIRDGAFRIRQSYKDDSGQEVFEIKCISNDRLVSFSRPIYDNVAPIPDTDISVESDDLESLCL